MGSELKESETRFDNLCKKLKVESELSKSLKLQIRDTKQKNEMRNYEYKSLKSLLSNFEDLLRKRTNEFDDLKRNFEQEKMSSLAKDKETECLENEIRSLMNGSESLQLQADLNIENADAGQLQADWNIEDFDAE